MEKFLPFILFSLLCISIAGCYYDKEEVVFPPGDCDTVDVSYSKVVVPILSNRCYSCHSTVPSGNIGLDDHHEVVVYAENGRLMGAIRHEDSYQPMPGGGGKLTDCQISQIQAWINQGKKNN